MANTPALYPDNKNIPEDMLLGNLIFMSITDMKIADSELRDVFTKANISESYIRDISPADAFRRATSSVKGRKIVIGDIPKYGSNIECKIEVDEVRCDTESIKRIIGVKNVNSVYEEINYDPAIEIVFNRNMNDIICTPVLTCNTNELSDIQKEITDNFYEWSVFHNRATIKNLINRIVWSTHPVNLTSSGVCKFIPKKYSDLLYNLKDGLSIMNQFKDSGNDSDNICEIIPVIDTDTQRDLISKNAEAEITAELFAFTQELKEIIQNKTTISPRTANTYRERLRNLTEKAEDYENLLGFYKESLHKQIERTMNFVDANAA